MNQLYNVQIFEALIIVFPFSLPLSFTNTYSNPPSPHPKQICQNYSKTWKEYMPIFSWLFDTICAGTNFSINLDSLS